MTETRYENAPRDQDPLQSSNVFSYPPDNVLKNDRATNPEDQGPRQSVFSLTCLHYDEQAGEVRSGDFQLRATSVGMFFEHIFMGDILTQLRVTRMTQVLPPDLRKVRRFEAGSKRQSLFGGCKSCKAPNLEPMLIEGTSGARELLFLNVQQTFELGVIAKHAGMPVEWE